MPPPTFAPDTSSSAATGSAELLGVGHVAEVYLADDLSLQRDVVVKVLLAASGRPRGRAPGLS